MSRPAKSVAIVQGRMSSSRLPGKVMREICGRSMISLLLERLARAREVDAIVVATSDTPSDDILAEHIAELGIACHRGSLDDVLDRFHGAAVASGADIVLRITADCPLIDPGLVDRCVQRFKVSGADYLSNAAPPTFPDGLDTEVFTARALAEAAREATDPFDREHVTPYLRNNIKYAQAAVSHEVDLSARRWTVDEVADLTVVRQVFEHFHPNTDFEFADVLNLHETRPDIFAANRHIGRNEGAEMGAGQKLWRRAKAVIPGGNMLLSKRPEMFLPEKWPSYFSKAKGCTVWDLDGNEYTDLCIMGIGTNILGYGHARVDGAVAEVVANGNMSTLNCPEEVYLAEKLVELHPWADMVRFARSGGEANAIAIRIARAASGKDQVAVCGYHGWHDWYLSANLTQDEGLSTHLLPGLDPAGVPKELAGTVHTFEYNNYAQLEEIVKVHDIGVIKMEVQRSLPPEDNFLHKVRALADAHNIVLIFDECTSGFRQSYGGLHKLYGVEPDMAMFGKALGNGYAITAVIGRNAVMSSAQSTFISSTFWTERIGPTAGLASLETMADLKSWEVITTQGQYIKSQMDALATRHGVTINQWGIPALTGYTFETPTPIIQKTYITQEMLKKGYLVGNSVYVCIEHTNEVIDRYIEALDPIFAYLARHDDDEIAAQLEGPVCHDGFRRLN